MYSKNKNVSYEIVFTFTLFYFVKKQFLICFSYTLDKENYNQITKTN